MKFQLTQKTLPLVIVIVLFGTAWLLKSNPPQQPSRAADNGPRMSVETLILEPRSYQVGIESYGTVRPKVQSLLVAQVSGQIVDVSDNFANGGFFKRGDRLLAIDDRDYRANVKIAEATLLDAKQALIEEQARSEQARKDWARLGNTTEPNDLVLRKPQLLAAKARLISAESNLLKAQLDLERATILAPFDGRVMKTSVDMGQVVGSNAVLGEIYASDVLEVRLPVRNRDLKFIRLPELTANSVEASEKNNRQGSMQGQPSHQLPVAEIFSGLIEEQSWPALIVRTESAIDETSRQLHVVAEIDQPFAKSAGALPQIKIGQYVTATIDGVQLEDALVIPVSSIYQGAFVYVVESGYLQKRPVKIAWQNSDDAVIEQGLSGGDELVLSSLGQVISGTAVNVLGRDAALAQPAPERPPSIADSAAGNAKGSGESLQQSAIEGDSSS